MHGVLDFAVPRTTVLPDNSQVFELACARLQKPVRSTRHHDDHQRTRGHSACREKHRSVSGL
ncbi:hypothetical protein D5S10_19885 [Pseudomonas savastanoi]|nr:hypothetical protein D5S10_19885 [Pseudomonas savastanoi]